MTRAAASLVLLALSLAGCGLKGPLYLPAPQPAAPPGQTKEKPATPADTPAPAAGTGAPAP